MKEGCCFDFEVHGHLVKWKAPEQNRTVLWGKTDSEPCQDQALNVSVLIDAGANCYLYSQHLNGR